MKLLNEIVLNEIGLSLSKRFDHSNRRRGSVCAAGSAAAVILGGDVDSIVVVDGRRVNRLDGAVLIISRYVEWTKVDTFLLTLDKC